MKISADVNDRISADVMAGMKRQDLLRKYQMMSPSSVDKFIRLHRNSKSYTTILMKAASVATHRDPCPRCGVRADVGCSHTPVHFGMTSRIGG